MRSYSDVFYVCVFLLIVCLFACSFVRTNSFVRLFICLFPCFSFVFFCEIQPPFVILTSPGHRATLGNQRSCDPGPGKLFHSWFCVQPTYSAPEYLTCTDTTLSGYQITPWQSEASEIHFLCPEKFMLGQCRIRITELSISRRKRFHWTNAP